METFKLELQYNRYFLEEKENWILVKYEILLTVTIWIDHEFEKII